MYSIGFPNMIGSNSTNLLKDKQAIKSNLILLLNSERMSLFGDPYFGTTLKKTLFEQSTSIISDLLIDEIYTTIITFIPQIYIERKNISLSTDGKSVYATLNVTYRLDNTSDLYTIRLISAESEE